MKSSLQKLSVPEHRQKLSFYLSVLSLCLAAFIASLDASITNVALPNISAELDIAAATAVWIVNSYQLVMVALILPIAAFADQIGYKKIFIYGLIIFTLASYLCGHADSINQLLGARAIQGLGAAAILGSNLALVRLTYDPAHLGLGLGINAFVIAMGLAGGPVLATLILAIASWQWLFLINIPIGMLAYLFAMNLPNQKTKTVKHYNFYSAVLCVLMFSCLIYALGSFTLNVSKSLSLVILLLGIVCGWQLFRRDSRHPAPIFPFDLFSHAIFSLSIFTACAAFIAQGLAMVALPFLFHQAGFSQSQIGWLIAPWACMGAITAPFAGIFTKNVSPALLGLTGLLLLGVGLLILAFTLNHLPYEFIVMIMFCCGLGFGLFLTPNQQMAIANSPLNKSGAASGMLNVARSLGQAIGATGVALSFSLGYSNYVLWIGVIFAFIAAFLSLMRLEPLKKKE
ncbi:MFS transporter [Acinetobacter vivianii]|uniref:MFS transporter n=1 Tax=Acinetobacter vivianii TaxID=1776742 RepID=UPI002DB9A10D|nr:MFS transporter [Acinetobacter vivianii]MEB6478882.1 MFS transporter [Acinetobacter vivianii]MEB6657286.1 MFS transporter [Acinetobacter vivianii]